MFNPFKKKKKDIIIKAPCDGVIIDLTAVEDEAFAKGYVGVGCAIIPESKVIYSPIKGTITHIFETNHAITMTNESGIELLIHLGLDTVQLNGQGFIRLSQTGLDLSENDAIIETDWDFIISKDKPITSPILITNYEDFEVSQVNLGKVKKGDPIMTVVRKD